ncbi:ATP-binding protein [Paenibacillus dokdonensis]|uniref:ATP-binding protein n=1 Tax=Paenibacillus dokdonensis TaxID=2567944 RepID=UPI0010A78B58|nr:ATP-binding protein [Paenibacillus dokdonensis]
MLGEIKTIIEKTNPNNEAYKFGFINGEDNKSYYFDKYSFPLESNGINKFSNGDSITFTPVRSNKNNDRAENIYPATVSFTINEKNSHTGSGEIHFFRKGFVKHIARNKSSVYTQHLKKEAREDVILDKLSNLLYVSKIDHFDMDKGDRYPFALLGTTEILKRYVRGQREFLLVFSHFDSRDWQDRTLKAEREIRKLKEVVDRNPLPNFYMLVSNADGLKNRIDGSIKGKPMAAIIPFSFDEILGCKTNEALKDLILNRFAEYHFENNMLGESTAIEEDNLLFGDRGKIADAIVERCRQGGNSGIFGLRRSGKTSVLNASLRRLDKENIKYIKIESRSELQNSSSWKAALYFISRRIKEKINNMEQRVEESYTDYLSRLKLNRTFEDFSENASLSFVEDVKLYCRANHSFVIAIDEIELITYNTASTQAWKSMEAYCGFWGALRDCGCSLIICGVNSAINEISTITFDGVSGDNPMYERITSCSESYKTYLPAFTDEHTKHMINTLGGYSDIGFSNVYPAINKSFGGQPYAIRQFCAFVFENVKSMRTHTDTYEVSQATVDNLLIKFNSSNAGRSLYETVLQHVRTYYKNEYIILEKMALSPQAYNSIGASEVQTIDHLEKYGLIEYDHGTSFVTFKIHSIREYLCEVCTKDPLTMDNDERRRYVQDFVANFEKKLKTHIYTYYNITGKEREGRNILKKFVTANENYGTRLDINTCKFEEIFEHKKFIMYFSSLKKIISLNWNYLGQKFENININKNRFQVYMDDLNAGRTDADHYDAEDIGVHPTLWDINDDTIQRFRVAMEALSIF